MYIKKVPSYKIFYKEYVKRYGRDKVSVKGVDGFVRACSSKELHYYMKSLQSMWRVDDQKPGRLLTDIIHEFGYKWDWERR